MNAWNYLTQELRRGFNSSTSPPSSYKKHLRLTMNAVGYFLVLSDYYQHGNDGHYLKIYYTSYESSSLYFNFEKRSHNFTVFQCLIILNYGSIYEYLK